MGLNRYESRKSGSTNVQRMSHLTSFVLLFTFVLLSDGAFLPPNTAATRWTSDMVLCYMDARSTPGPQMNPEFVWSAAKFAMLLAKQFGHLLSSALSAAEVEAMM